MIHSDIPLTYEKLTGLTQNEAFIITGKLKSKIIAAFPSWQRYSIDFFNKLVSIEINRQIDHAIPETFVLTEGNKTITATLCKEGNNLLQYRLAN
ncbi:MAG TPA: hypothetical protein VF941_00265 [Clostridia bacterium]